MKRTVCLIGYLLCIVTFQPASAEENDIGDYTIRKIEIIRHNVFDLTKPEESGFIGRKGNAFHIVTREKIILQELFFKEGDKYDKELIEESERSLRRYSFLTNVKITAIPDHESKTVDVTVETRDQWSFIIGATFGGTSDNNETGLDFGEKNLAGTGQSLSYRMRHTNDGFSNSYGYSDNTFLDTRYTLGLGFKTLPNEKRYDLMLEKPFYSLNTKTAHGISFEQKDHDETDFVFDSRRLVAFYGWALDFGENIVRMKLNFSFGKEEVQRGTAVRKSTTDNRVLGSADILLNPRDFAKDTYLEKFRQVEDIPLGTTITVALGPELEALGSTKTDLSAEFGISRNFIIGERDYLFASFVVRRNDDDFNDQFADIQLKYYMRWFDFQTVVLHMQGSYMESDTNIFRLGGTSGLRGYKTDEFEGQSQLIINLEDRIYTFRSMFSGIIEPGFVIFADFGNTWRNEQENNLRELHGGVGVGIRLALLKAPGISLIRMDWGYPLDMHRSPVLTIGMEGFF